MCPQYVHHPLSPLDLDKSHKYQQLSIFQIRWWLPLPLWKCLHLLHQSNTIWILNEYKLKIFQKWKKEDFSGWSYLEVAEAGIQAKLLRTFIHWSLATRGLFRLGTCEVAETDWNRKLTHSLQLTLLTSDNTVIVTPRTPIGLGPADCPAAMYAMYLSQPINIRNTNQLSWPIN